MRCSHRPIAPVEFSRAAMSPDNQPQVIKDTPWYVLKQVNGSYSFKIKNQQKGWKKRQTALVKRLDYPKTQLKWTFPFLEQALQLTEDFDAVIAEFEP